MNSTEAVKLLQSIEIFREVPQAVLQNLAAQIVETELKADDIIIRKGEEGSSMFIIVSGSVKIHDGEHVVANIQAGSFFGEFSLLDSAPRSMSVTALEPVDLFKIERENFFKVLENQPAVTKKIISVLTKRLRTQNASIIEQLKSREQELTSLVEERTFDLRLKNKQLVETLDKLQDTQQQLIHAEKMASLGQLTAGIAHEIRNPLNFVKNFSEFSLDLMTELLNAKSKEEEKELMDTLKQNIAKINEHGLRADSIVKSMLEHSRMGSSEKQPADINRLCEEYLNLALHGWRAQQQNFTCSIEKNFEKELPPVQVMAQDIGRVLINIFNNGFYAMSEKLAKSQSGGDGKDYTPLISIKTMKQPGKVIIVIRDNGTGIPQKNIDKVFQPFFTTKPTGFGNTGLGLSISYDIIKTHQGEIKVESMENEWTEFTISLPVSEKSPE